MGFGNFEWLFLLWSRFCIGFLLENGKKEQFEKRVCYSNRERDISFFFFYCLFFLFVLFISHSSFRELNELLSY